MTLYGHRYFRRMIAQFEEKIGIFSSQIDELQSHLTVGGGSSLTPQSNTSQNCHLPPPHSLTPILLPLSSLPPPPLLPFSSPSPPFLLPLSSLPPPFLLLPVDLIEVLQLQYKPFLVLASQLQTLHEQVQVKGKSLAFFTDYLISAHTPCLPPVTERAVPYISVCVLTRHN